MYRFGWLLLGLGVLMLLGKGFFLLPLFALPFIIWPLMGMLMFRRFAHGPGAQGPWDHGYGRHGYSRHRCGERRPAAEIAEPAAEQAERPRGYTGETTRL